MKKQINPMIRTQLIRGASYLLLLLAVCAIPFALGQRQTHAPSAYTNTITVINTNDSGPGSLRQALADANNGDMINFDPALKGQTVTLTTAELVINKNIAISGPGPNLLAVSRAQNAPAFRIFNIMPGRSVTIQGLTISNGIAFEFGCGGGVLDEGSSLSLINCTVSGNSTDGTGGGICVDANATLTIDSSTLSGNYAGDYGGGIANSGTLTISNSTLTGNRGEFTGGAILNGFNAGASLTINNSTLSGNTTQLHGGGIWTSGQSAIRNSTLSGNSGTNGGAINNRLGTLEIKSTVLNRGDSGTNIVNDSGTVISHGYNVSSDDGGGSLNGPGDQINTDPMLASLQNNGGPTFTHALLPGSPAIDTGDPNFTPPPYYDQRGPVFWRVRNGRIDVGSFEVQTGTTPSPTPSSTASPTPCTPGGTPGFWTQAAPVGIDHYGGFMDSDGTHAFEGGGYSFMMADNINQFGRFDPVANTWTSLAPVPDLNNSMASGVYAPNVNKLFVFGGDRTDTGTYVNTTRIYDIATNTWSTGANMPDVRSFMASGYYNGKIYLVCGYNASDVTTAQAQVWQYDPITNTFNTTRVNHPHALGGAGFGCINGHLYTVGGRDASNTVLNLVYDYDISADTWTQRANVPTAINVPGSAVIAGKLWVFGGGNPFVGSGTLPKSNQNGVLVPDTTNILQIYDPATDIWTSGPPLNQQRSFPAARNVGNTAVAVGGRNGSVTTTSVEINVTTGGCTATPTVTATATATATPTPTATPTATATPRPTITPRSTPPARPRPTPPPRP